MAGNDSVPPSADDEEEISGPITVLRAYIGGLRYVLKHWDELDTQTRFQAKVYYAYSLAVFIGVPLLSLLTVWYRLR